MKIWPVWYEVAVASFVQLKKGYATTLLPYNVIPPPPPPPPHNIPTANWECHSEVADMIQLQRMGLQGAPGEMGTEGRGEEERSPMTGGRQGHQENKFALLMQMEDADT